MRQYILVTARADNGSSPADRRSAIQDILVRAREFSRYAFPATEDVKTVEWVSPNGHAAAIAVSNEPDGFQHDISHSVTDHVFLGLEGYTTSLSATDHLRASHDLLETSQSMGGCFTVYRASDHGITAVTDAAGTGNACHAESDRFRILSNRTLWAHLVAQHDSTHALRPVLELDDLALRNLANSGSINGTRTLFRGVTMLKRRSQHSATPWGIRERTIDFPVREAGVGWEPSEEELVQVCDSLVSAFAPLRGTELNLSLTGGRDSRMLLAAALHVDGMDLRASTSGEPHDADVVLAELLCRTLGVPHTRVAPPRAAPDVLVSEPPHARIKRVLDGHDWSISAWDDMPDYGPFSPRPSMSGVGGEGLRGGMIMAGMETMESKTVATQLFNLQAGAPDLFRDHVNEAALEDGHFWREFAYHDPYAAADRYYKDERANHWAASRRAAARLRSHAIDPLFDNRFMASYELIPAAYKWDERLAFAIISRLAPEISNAPIEGHPWKFDAQNCCSANGQSSETRATRRSVTTASRSGVRAWRTLDAPSLRASVAAFIEGHLDGPVSNVLHPAGVRTRLREVEKVQPAMLWNIATVCAAASVRTVNGSRSRLENSVEVRDAPHS